jgi:hypothetical protein
MQYTTDIDTVKVLLKFEILSFCNKKIVSFLCKAELLKKIIQIVNIILTKTILLRSRLWFSELTSRIDNPPSESRKTSSLSERNTVRNKNTFD